MRVIIAGSRSITRLALVEAAVLRSGFEVTEVVSGTARGVDLLGEAWAQARGIPVTRFPADWARYGRAGGHVRNCEMVAYARQAGGALIAVWDGVSRGTRHVIEYARAQGLQVYVGKPVPREAVLVGSGAARA
jgi:hypothetical protein